MNRILFFFFVLIGTQSFSQTPPTTRLDDIYCYNYNLPTIYSNFLAIKKTCDGYIFDVQNMATNQTAQYVTTGNVAGRTTNLSFFSAAGITYNTTYKVTVRTWIGTTSNASTPSLVSCYVITPSPASKVQTSQCNTTLSAYNTPVYVDNIPGAEAFKFQLKKLPGGTYDSIEKTSGTLNAFSMSDFPLAFADYSTTYEVRVKVKVNGTYANYGTMCTITTPGVPQTQLESSSCNQSIPYINSPLSASAVPGASAYRFQVSNGVNNTIIYPSAPGNNAVLIPVSWATYSGNPSPNNLDWISNNMTVQVSVSALVDGTWYAWGPTCNVTTPCGSKLTAAMNSKLVNYMYYDELLAEVCNCSGIQDYQFRYRIGFSSTTYLTASSGNENAENASDNKLFLSDFGPISNFPASNPYGKTYRISVRVKINGVWSDWGTERSVLTPSAPTTKIRDGLFSAAGTSQCGTSGSPFLMSNIGTILYSYNLYGFSNYTFEVTRLSDNNVLTLTRTATDLGAQARGMRLSMVGDPALNGTNGPFKTDYNTTFMIRVKTNLGSYGNACYVRTPAAIGIPEATEELMPEDIIDTENIFNDQASIEEESSQNFEDNVNFFPNPYTNKMGIQYSSEFSEKVEYTICDISGKIIFKGISFLDDLAVEEFWTTLKDGNYLITLTNEQNKSITKRIVKTR